MSRTDVAAPSESSFFTDIKTLHERAHKHIEEGVVTEDYKADRETVLRLLNETLTTELICVPRYRHHHFMAEGISAEPIAAGFLVHTNEEQAHVDSITTRIVQLGGGPNFNPGRLPTRSRSEYVEADGLVDMIKENLVTERVAIDNYLEMIRYIGDRDPTTRRVPERVLAAKEERTDELSSMLHDQQSEGGRTRYRPARQSPLPRSRPAVAGYPDHPV